MKPDAMSFMLKACPWPVLEPGRTEVAKDGAEEGEDMRLARRTEAIGRHFATLALVLFTGACDLAMGATAADSALKAVLEGRYAAMKSAMASRDAAAVSAVLTADFVSEDAQGRKEGKDPMLREVSALPNDPKKSSTTTVVSVERHGDTAVAMQRYEMHTEKAKGDGSVQHVELVTLSRDTWVRDKDVWLLRETVTESLDYQIDGRVVAHQEHRSEAAQSR